MTKENLDGSFHFNAADAKAAAAAAKARSITQPRITDGGARTEVGNGGLSGDNAHITSDQSAVFRAADMPANADGLSFRTQSGNPVAQPGMRDIVILPSGAQSRVDVAIRMGLITPNFREPAAFAKEQAKRANNEREFGMPPEARGEEQQRLPKVLLDPRLQRVLDEQAKRSETSGEDAAGSSDDGVDGSQDEATQSDEVMLERFEEVKEALSEDVRASLIEEVGNGEISETTFSRIMEEGIIAPSDLAAVTGAYSKLVGEATGATEAEMEGWFKSHPGAAGRAAQVLLETGSTAGFKELAVSAKKGAQEASDTEEAMLFVHDRPSFEAALQKQGIPFRYLEDGMPIVNLAGKGWFPWLEAKAAGLVSLTP